MGEEDLLALGGPRPAKGLRVLTWPQVEKVDEVLSSLCLLTRSNDGDATVTIKVRKGKVRFIERPVLSEELSPAR